VEWHVVGEMPRNAAGKIVKPRLKERLEAPHAPQSDAQPSARRAVGEESAH